MPSLLVVGLEPLIGYFPNLIEILEEVSVKHFVSVGSIKPLHEGILIRLAWLDIAKLNAMTLTPSPKIPGQKFRPVVEPKHLG